MTKKDGNQKTEDKNIDKPITDKDVKKLEKIVDKLFDLLDIEVEKSVSKDIENNALRVDIKTENEAGLLIGNKGRTLESIQTILGMVFRKETDDWKRITVNVADWREKEERRLKDLAEQAAERAISTGEAQAIYNLTPAQRRIIHLYLSENDNIQTESKGEGKDRFLLILPK